MPLFLRRIANRFFPKTRRYRDAVFAYPDLTEQMATPLRTRLYRWIFKPEHCDASGAAARRIRTLRLVFFGLLLWGLLAFFTESLSGWNFFSGN